MKVKTYSPEGPLRSDKVGIVLFNHLGSSVDSDTGDDASFAANNLGLHIMAVNRPGTRTLLPTIFRRLPGYEEAMRRLARKRIAPELGRLGLTHVILYGRSAGATGALMAAQTGELPMVAAVHAQEPIGWRSIGLWAGLKTYYRYQQTQRKLVNDPGLLLERPEPGGLPWLRRITRDVSNKARSGIDILSNQCCWSVESSYRAAYRIARHMPGVQLDVRFADRTYTLGEGQTSEKLETELAGLRAMWDDPQPVSIETIPNTVHSSFDKRSFAIGLLGHTITDVLARVDVESRSAN